MDNELFELCKQVYEKTGWETDRFYWSDTRNPEKYIPAVQELKVIDYKPKWLHGKDNDDNHIVPLYTSDYLLEKLPKYISTYGDMGNDYVFRLQSCFQPNEWWAYYLGNGEKMQYHQVADTPLKVLLKLTLALAEAGELK